MVEPHIETVDDRLSADLGFDVASVELQAQFGLDVIRMRTGKAGELGYLLIDTDDGARLAVVYPSHDHAAAALDESELVDLLCEESLSGTISVPAAARLADIAGREIVLPT